MTEFDAREIVGDALGELAAGLRPFIDEVFAEVLPGGPSWTDVLERKDRQAGRGLTNYNPRDLSLQLRVMTEALGTLGYPFSNRLTRQASNCASELRGVRNKWAHYEDFTVAETYRALDSAELLLRVVKAEAPADVVARRKADVLALMAAAAPAERAVGEDAHATREGAQTISGAQDDEPTAVPEDGIASPAAEGVPYPGVEKAELSLRALPVLSYAMARGSIEVVNEVQLDYEGMELRGASIEVEALCALGALGDPKVVIVDLDASTRITLRDADLRLDPARMLAVDTQLEGELRITFRHPDGAVIAQKHVPVVVLAANQWMATPPQLAMEILSAFVQPHSPAIASLLVEASDRLQSKTGNSALDGYQQESPERVDAIAECVYEAIRARDIRYAEPPASWGLVGQKVRTPREVLEDRLGTCMDTTVTLAAALEQAGINSTLWLMQGHIFLGYWRVGSSLEVPAQPEVSEVVNLVDLGHIALIETTMLTGGAMSRPFAEARRAPHTSHLAGSLERFIGVTDVMQARESQIFPLPTRWVGADGDVVVHEYATAARPDALSYSPGAAAIAGDPNRRTLPARVSQWKNALLDLSLRNRLIHYTDRAGYSLAIPQPSLPRFEDMVNSGVGITLLPSDRVPSVEVARGLRSGRDLPEAHRDALMVDKKQAYVDITEATYTPRLRALAYKARTIVEETGANNLYLAFGMLRWTFNDRELRSPLVLVPVTLESVGRGQAFRIVLDEAGESTPNYCLLEKLRVAKGLEIPGLANPAKDDSGIDLPAAFAAVRESVARARLPFTVEDTVDLSILQFAKFRLWKDLDDNWEQLAANSLVSHLIATPTEPYRDPAPEPAAIDLDELSNLVPVPADSSQLGAVAEAVADRTFVLEGPPGTGKSQTITNLLARSLSAGKRVLFVAEKRAALDVVKQRLDAVGLGPFSLDLHDKGARPNAVRAQIKAALDASSRPDRATLKTNAEAAATSRGSLARYASRLHETNSAGLSLYSARLQLLSSAEDVVPLEVPLSLVASGTEEDFELLRARLRSLPETADLAHPTALHPWGFVDLQPGADLPSSVLHSAAQEFDVALSAVREAGADAALLALTRTPQQIDTWASLARAPRHSLEAIDAAFPRGLSGEIPQYRAAINAATADAPAWFASVSPAVMTEDVRGVHAASLAADQSSFFGRKKRRREVLDRLGANLKTDPKSFPLRSLSSLTADIVATTERAEMLRSGLLSLPVAVATSSWNPYLRDDAASAIAHLDWLSWLGSALTATTTTTDDSFRQGLRAFYRATAASEPLALALARLGSAWRALAAAAQLAEPESSTHEFARWAGERDFFGAWEATRAPRNLDSSTPVTLDRWLALVRHLEPLRTYGLDQARADLLAGRVPADDASLAFDKGLAAASIREREDATALVDFDVAAHNRTIERFTTSADAIRSELPRVIPADILDLRRFDPNYDGGEMGALKRQLGRQRGGMSVRALFENHGALITQITPCVLMSPESVARFFPAHSAMFDIVVFDEASQIRVADAVGAMGRGRSVVVVGDSKQMPPTSFAEVGTDIDSEADAAAEVVSDEESILTECVMARVPSKWLSWHYRSQDESLIMFSNHAYYESRLSSFPAPLRSGSALTDVDHGLSMVRVNGRFNRSGKGRDLRTNEVEARAIVDEVSRRFAASSDGVPSLGIITFNVQQRTLIETLLREAPDERIVQALDARDGLFVKNLENVQGDERDVILFSVAFSENERGVIPLNFGPLTRAGGERRLNVAITRARRQVILFASFDPSDLRAEQTSSVGIKHLKAYLELARSGAQAETDDPNREPVRDRHRDDIAAELRLRGFAVSTDVGLSDFRVDISIAAPDDPAQPLVAVLLDGEGWRSRRTVADRDGLPVDVLRGLMKWPGVERVWMPEWLDDREGTLDRLARAVDEARADLHLRETAVPPERDAGYPGPGATSTSSARIDTSGEKVLEPAEGGALDSALVRGLAPVAAAPLSGELRHPNLREFTAWVPARRGSVETLDRLPAPAATASVVTLLREVIQAEGPIHKMRLAKLVAEAFGLSRVAAARAQSILNCLPTEYVRTGEKSCAWPAGVDPAEWRIARRSRVGDGRNIDHVPLDEIANGMAIVAELGGGMHEDELKREALRLFGGIRMTEGVVARMNQGLERGLTTGRLERSASGVLKPVALE